jgi:Mn2+/Fe2+ NRAMP family transporter
VPTRDQATRPGTVAGRSWPARRRWTLLAMLALWGPGLIVMLADTDAGCIITASQSGAQFGYAMVLPQVVLMPVLFAVQEITVRLGIVTGKGHGELIRERFGLRWGLVSAGTLVLSAIGALLTEFAGVAGVGELFGVSKWVTIPTATVFLLGLAFTGSYKRAERIGIAVGLAELTFVPAMLLAHPSVHGLLHGAANLPLGNQQYVFLLAANVGAVIMPWMIFYQQGAVVQRGLTVKALRQARLDTGVGTILTQGIMIVVVIALAASVGRTNPGAALNDTGQIARAMAPFLGSARTADILIGASILGGALVAALVVSLAGSWGLAEVLGWKHSLNERVSRRNARFYLTYALAHVAGAALVLASVNLVGLAVDCEVMNALLLPIVLGFLLLLEAKCLPAEYRMRGAYRVILTALCVIVIIFGLIMIPQALGWNILLPAEQGLEELAGVALVVLGHVLR